MILKPPDGKTICTPPPQQAWPCYSLQLKRNQQSQRLLRYYQTASPPTPHEELRWYSHWRERLLRHYQMLLLPGAKGGKLWREDQQGLGIPPQ